MSRALIDLNNPLPLPTDSLFNGYLPVVPPPSYKPGDVIIVRKLQYQVPLFLTITDSPLVMPQALGIVKIGQQRTNPAVVLVFLPGISSYVYYNVIEQKPASKVLSREEMKIHVENAIKIRARNIRRSEIVPPRIPFIPPRGPQKTIIKRTIADLRCTEKPLGTPETWEL